MGISVLAALTATLLGIYVAFRLDLPANQTIALITVALFALSVLARWLKGAIKG